MITQAKRHAAYVDMRRGWTFKCTAVKVINRHTRTLHSKSIKEHVCFTTGLVLWLIWAPGGLFNAKNGELQPLTKRNEMRQFKRAMYADVIIM